MAERRPPARFAAAPAPVARPASDATPGGSAAPARREILPAQLARIRTWLRYGMTIGEVAAIYGVEIDEIEQMLREA